MKIRAPPAPPRQREREIRCDSKANRGEIRSEKPCKGGASDTRRYSLRFKFLRSPACCIGESCLDKHFFGMSVLRTRKHATTLREGSTRRGIFFFLSFSLPRGSRPHRGTTRERSRSPIWRAAFVHFTDRGIKKSRINRGGNRYYLRGNVARVIPNGFVSGCRPDRHSTQS